MRTGIYVQQSTTATIRASAPQDALVQLIRFQLPAGGDEARPRVRAPAAVGTHELEAGVYLIVSSSPMQVEGANLTTQIVAHEKNPWPDPDVAASLVPGATAEQVLQFFSISKGIEVGDAPQESTEPITKITDDPDGI
jgi:hypothetical protein